MTNNYLARIIKLRIVEGVSILIYLYIIGRPRSTLGTMSFNITRFEPETVAFE